MKTGELVVLAARAGISRESQYLSLSVNGNPTLKTLLAVLKAVGMKLSVEQDRQAARGEEILRCRPC